MATQITTALISALVSLVAVLLSYLYNKRVITQKNSEDEKKEIYKKLNEFFGPFQAIRKKNKLIYEIFVSQYKKNDPDFRTLHYFLDGNELSGNEKLLFEEILKNNDVLEKILIEKAGLVDSAELRKHYFPQFLAHCCIIKLAYNKQLTGEKEKFMEHTFPKGIDDYVEKEFIKYKERLVELNSIRFLI